MYKINIKNKANYYSIINCLFEKCDKFKLVDAYHNVDYDSSSNILANLHPFCIEEKLVRNWPGTRSSRKAKLYTFPINRNILKIFKEYSNFFELEGNDGCYISFECEQLDVSFYYKDKCVLYTTTHEGICIGKKGFLRDCLKDNNILFEEW